MRKLRCACTGSSRPGTAGAVASESTAFRTSIPIAYAAAIRLPLTAIVIDNQSSTHGWPGGIAARFPGWTATVVDGRDHQALERALERRDRDRPNLVVATVEPKWG